MAAVARCNPNISRYIAQRDTAGLSGKPRCADAYLNNSFIYFCERLIRSQRICLMKIEEGTETNVSLRADCSDARRVPTPAGDL